jgi:hypothetical protein
MVKRTTAVFHILMVSILLLAHAVIPHIHFENEIVITGIENHPDKESCKHHHHKHSEDKGDTEDFCLLKQVYLTRANDTGPDDDEPEWLKNQNDSPHVQLVILNSSEALLFAPLTTAFHKTCVASFYSYPGSGNINSRGSPGV